MPKKQNSIPKTYVLGVLGVPPGDDAHIKNEICFISDFYATKQLFGDRPFQQTWLCQFDVAKSLEHLRNRSDSTSTHTLPHGPPTSQCFCLHERFYTIAKDLRAKTLIQITSMASRAQRKDHIVLAFFSQGQRGEEISEKGAIQLGCQGPRNDAEWLDADDVKDCLQVAGTKAKVTIITTSCFADWQWLHGPWDLVAASRQFESHSLPAPVSDGCWPGDGQLIAPFPEIAANDFEATFYGDSQYKQHLVLSHQAFPRPNGRESLLSVPQLEDKITKLAAQMQRTTSDEVIEKLRPCISTNGQWLYWSDLIGIDDPHTIDQQSHALQRVDSGVQASNSVTGSLVTASPRTPKVQDEDDERIEKAGPVDLTRLQKLLLLWKETSAGTLLTHSHKSIANLIRAYDQKELSMEKTRVLYTSLVWREEMEQRAEQVLANFEETKCWISSSCRTYTELQGWIDTSPPHENLDYGQILWGLLDELDLKALGGGGGTIYRKPSQWLWLQWRKSGSGVPELQKVLSRLKGRIHSWTDLPPQ